MQEQKEKLINSIKALVAKYRAGELTADDKLYLSMRELDLLFGEEKDNGESK